ncbi:MAG: segregation/condensation protein A [Candidatus Norongarragalinales archaeon]
MDLLEVVVQPTWREFLVDLVQSEKMDPWDIDLCEVADKCLERIKNWESLDLRIPANVILASSLLLRFKADALEWKPLEEYYDAAVEETPMLIQEELPELILKPNRPRARRVTLQELMTAVESVMKQGRRIQRIIPAPIALNVQLPQKTMGERISDVFEKAKALKDADSLVLFSELSEGKTVEHFIPILHLVNSQKVDAWQDEVFGEIFLKVLSESIGDAAEIAQSEQAAKA